MCEVGCSPTTVNAIETRRDCVNEPERGGEARMTSIERTARRSNIQWMGPVNEWKYESEGTSLVCDHLPRAFVAVDKVRHSTLADTTTYLNIMWSCLIT
jgi:hypothetical protein